MNDATIPSSDARLKELFVAAIEVPPAERETFLEEQCGDDATLRTALTELLSTYDRANGFFDGSTFGADGNGAESDPAPLPPSIGSHKILQVIGEGGFGTVYLAEQQHPVRRRVAVKVIKLGMDTKQVIARFEAERQALAMMDHPNIARVFDAGATEQGRPYFVMELVGGVPITKYCDAHKLTTRQRLELFVPICRAVHHAHQKGVIHRDIKPTNILIAEHDGRAVPKIIDFGIAKATEARLTDKTIFTEFRSMIGTPEYISPEQAQMGGIDVDTRSDVYSLGVLLYELLTGSTPFVARELRSKSYEEMQRLIREVDPPRPSTRISMLHELPTIAACRSTEPRKLRSSMRGELDWIVMRCLEKDRARRYESAAALAADVSRYLADEPVSAVAPSRAYQLRKYVRRHRVGVLASAAVLLALVGGIVGTTIGLIRASHQRAVAIESERESKEQAAIADAVSRFQADMLASADPQHLLGSQVTVVDVMHSAVKELDAGKLKDQPLVEAAVRGTIGATFHALGEFEAAERSFSRALELRRAVTASNADLLVSTMCSLGAAQYSKGQPAVAEQTLREALTLARGVPDVSSMVVARTLNNLAIALKAQAKFDDAELLLREVNDLHARSGADDRTKAMAMANLAQALQEQGKLEDAELLQRSAMTIQRRVLSPAHPELILTLSNLAITLTHAERYSEAEPLAREALDGARETYPANHPAIASSLGTLGTILLQDGKYPEAETALREALAIERQTLPLNHPDIAGTLNNLATVLRFRDKHAESEAAYRETLQIARASLPAGHPNIAQCLQSLSRELRDQQKWGDAEAIYRESIEAHAQAYGADHWRVAVAKAGFGDVLISTNRHADAETVLLEAQRVYDTFGEQVPAWRREELIELLQRLYESWHAVDPQPQRMQSLELWRQRGRDGQPVPSTSPAPQPSR